MRQLWRRPGCCRRALRQHAPKSGWFDSWPAPCCAAVCCCCAPRTTGCCGWAPGTCVRGRGRARRPASKTCRAPPARCLASTPAAGSSPARQRCERAGRPGRPSGVSAHQTVAPAVVSPCCMGGTGGTCNCCLPGLLPCCHLSAAAAAAAGRPAGWLAACLSGWLSGSPSTLR